MSFHNWAFCDERRFRSFTDCSRAARGALSCVERRASTVVGRIVAAALIWGEEEVGVEAVLRRFQLGDCTDDGVRVVRSRPGGVLLRLLPLMLLLEAIS